MALHIPAARKDWEDGGRKCIIVGFFLVWARSKKQSKKVATRLNPVGTGIWLDTADFLKTFLGKGEMAGQGDEVHEENEEPHVGEWKQK